MKPTLILGASNNPQRYSYLATMRLKAYGHPVYPVGIKIGDIEGEKILNGMPALKDVDTITMYLGEKNQQQYYDYILNVITPKRIIFNPGAENEELAEMAEAKGIEALEACTLVMLSTKQY